MMPVIAASTVPMMVTASASEPATFLSRTWTQKSRSWATPLRSIITPMKTNAGTATSTRFSAPWNQIRGMKLKNSINEKTSRK